VTNYHQMFMNCKALAALTLGDGFVILNDGGVDTSDLFRNDTIRVTWGGETLDPDSWIAKATLTPPLKTGDTGDGVRWLQRVMSTLGFQVGSVDGQFGSRTADALKSFQANRGLTQTGEADAATIRALCAAAATA